VARQYSGTAGRIENCQIGVFLTYASSKGHALIDCALYLPEAWCADAERRAEAAIPEDVVFATKPVLARQMIDRALDAGIPCAWVLGDEVYGSDHKLRAALERREQASVLTVRCNEQFWAVRQKKTGWDTAAELADACPASAWQCHSAGAGTKGERLYDWARRAKGSVRRSRMEWQDEDRVPLARRGKPVQTPWQHWLLIRRHRQDPNDVAYYAVFAPANTSLATLARVAGMRWTVEECFGGQAGGRPRRVRGALLAGLVSPHHAGHARACLPGGHADQAQRLTSLKRRRGAVTASGCSQRVRDPPSHQPFVARGWTGSRLYLRMVCLAAHASGCRQIMPLENTRSLSDLRTKKLNCRGFQLG
jgi:hypothetical protein